MVNVGVPRSSGCSLPAISVALRIRRVLRELVIQPHSADRETEAQIAEGTGPSSHSLFAFALLKWKGFLCPKVLVKKDIRGGSVTYPSSQR